MLYNENERGGYMPEYYNPSKLLSKKDINGETPEIFIVSGNRSGGKTTAFSKLIINRWKKGKGKFILLYRHKNELKGCEPAFFTPMKELFFPEDEMTFINVEGHYHELCINDLSCGYALAISGSEYYKRRSNLFNDVGCIFFDEFQSENNNYLSDEISQIQSIHTSVARGHGSQSKYVPLYMCSNTVSLINPYFAAFGISTRLNKDTRFLRGEGFVFEQNYNTSASEAQKQSAFNRAFAQGNSDYLNYSSENVYLNDNLSFIEQPTGSNIYVCTIKYKGKNYAIRDYAYEGIVYCSDKADMTHPVKLSASVEDHDVNYVLVANNIGLISNLKYKFRKGCFRFKNLECKEAVLNLLSM